MSSPGSFSFWETERLSAVDVAIVGAGFVGLSLACELLEQNPRLRVVVLERGLWPQGASTRNAGFACVGSPTELLDDLQRMGHEAALNLVHERWLGLLALRRRLDDAQLEYDPSGGWELLLPQHANALQRLDELNHLLEPLFGPEPVFSEQPQRLRDFGFGGPLAGLVRNRLEGTLHPVAAWQGLQQRACRLGAQLLTGARVLALEPSPKGVELPLHNGPRLLARQVAVCTNAFAPQLLPQLDVVPGRGQVLLTNELPGGPPFSGSFHADEGYLYFRPLGRRVLLGGGRNRFAQQEQTEALTTTPEVQHYLDDFLRQVVLPGTTVGIHARWSGIMAFPRGGATKQPIVQQVQPGVFAGVRMGGMGVALSSRVAANLAGQMLEDPP